MSQTLLLPYFGETLRKFRWQATLERNEKFSLYVRKEFAPDQLPEAVRVDIELVSIRTTMEAQKYTRTRPGAPNELWIRMRSEQRYVHSLRYVPVRRGLEPQAVDTVYLPYSTLPDEPPEQLFLRLRWGAK